jgi:adenylylsulfate kinase-like enzyme
MRVIGLAGWSGAGKTTLIVKLIPYLRERGIDSQARASRLRCRSAGKRFLSAPRGRSRRGVGCLVKAFCAHA